MNQTQFLLSNLFVCATIISAYVLVIGATILFEMGSYFYGGAFLIGGLVFLIASYGAIVEGRVNRFLNRLDSDWGPALQTIDPEDLE